MPKRSYPFDTFAPPQMKTHIGQKELSAGVCGESLKREIFERTKKLLFNGAKAILGNQSNQNKDTDMESPVPELLNGQTTIGQDGKLLKASQTSTPAGGVKACSSCVRSVGDKEACEQCERYICSSCSNTCSCCSAITCSFCTTFVDSDLGEETFCTTCSVYEV
ncbi:apoptosis regulatory protein Siva [Hyperolius riggenbachi]|uniref:apoptosis regulatory protein Siva n=1 Tax=Hyperolius riggenbachi TaxID=752182 RepID=UPI0035A39736